MNAGAFWLLILTGVTVDRLWLHRHAVSDAIGRALDWLVTDPEPLPPIDRPPAGMRNVRVRRDGE